MGAKSGIPETVLEVTVSEVDEDAIPLLAVGAGYEDGAWRHDQLTTDLIAWVSDWILTPEELSSFGVANATAMLQKALGRVYASADYKRRGEIGELLLHIILRKFLGSQKVISRLYFKDAANDTVKGFDAVHIVESEGTGDLELWLGESKFYKDSSSAVNAVLAELVDHLSAVVPHRVV